MEISIIGASDEFARGFATWAVGARHDVIPVDFETGEPVRPRAGSAAEEIARALPRARVVKAFNSGFAGALVAGQTTGQPPDVFLASDDREAKRLVARLFEEGGLRAIDVGPLRRARELEAFGYLHVLLRQPLRSALDADHRRVSPELHLGVRAGYDHTANAEPGR